MKHYVKPIVEFIEFTTEEVVMNLVASSNDPSGGGAVPQPTPPQYDGDADV